MQHFYYKVRWALQSATEHTCTANLRSRAFKSPEKPEFFPIFRKQFFIGLLNISTNIYMQLKKLSANFTVSAALKGACVRFVVGLSYPFLKDRGKNCLFFRRHSIVVLLTD